MDYISEVASSLIENSICDSIVSPEFYTLIADWEKRKIPLVVVINAVEEYGKTGGDITAEGLKTVVGNKFRTWLQEAHTQ
ncbi:MAG: hypothetical protein ACKVQJ_10755 [Pyrinomonadaceae bacterium]